MEGQVMKQEFKANRADVTISMKTPLGHTNMSANDLADHVDDIFDRSFSFSTLLGMVTSVGYMIHDEVMPLLKEMKAKQLEQDEKIVRMEAAMVAFFSAMDDDEEDEVEEVEEMEIEPEEESGE